MNEREYEMKSEFINLRFTRDGLKQIVLITHIPIIICKFKIIDS